LILNTVVSLFLGVLLAVAVVLLQELLDRKVRSADDLLEYLKLSMLGEVSTATAMPTLALSGARA
jgi:capsular polysaccharide biosynthesis protein